ncbi:hypothetical protein FDF97_00770 [Clostridium botulinum]|uniref:Uncharacterized protein n=1 Tax=Clostridium botulinum TaxID=1491 RepID=A0A6G4EII8_CLOBO|nr:hypothetical protein NPD3_136 [Clostridium botulinum]AUM90974.1 hypothetical protein RSJ5_06725 [Clostridium botulinum]MBN3415455.1 hypothetical protein [Clostridium botulinum]MBN3441748.1 hypothetical protein [Clostridium botulinum]NFB14906.1 hypothetical protein [Clostridium botulinum]
MPVIEPLCLNFVKSGVMYKLYYNLMVFCFIINYKTKILGIGGKYET